MKKKSLQLLLFFCFITRLSYSQTLAVDTLVNNGNPTNRINLVFMGDGYTSSQQTQFITDVNTIVTKLFATAPFKEYQSFFNVYAIHVISQVSGAKHPNTALDCHTANPTVPVSSPSTYLSATFDYGGIHRLLYCTNTSAINSILQQNFPLYDKGLIVVNTPYYGGSGGTFSVCSADPSSAEIMIHELGHSFAGLGDEYGGTSCGGAELPNVTAQSNPSLIKWKDWIPSGISVPTASGTNCTAIGLYQGANYCNTGWYRPKCNCKMNMLGIPFCEVCVQTLIYSINNSISLIDSYQPPGGVTLSNGQTQNFSATYLTPAPNSIQNTWKLDNVVVASNASSYLVAGSTLSDGTHTLVLSVTDTTYRSKSTMPVYTKTWIITKNGSVSVTLAPFNAVCSNTSDFTLTGGSPAGGVYSGTGISNGIFSPATAGTGTFNITYTYSGVSAVQSITVKSLPNVTVSSNATICSGTSATLSSSGATTYTWSPNISLNTSTGATVIASPTINQGYNVTGTENGCTKSQTVFVFVTALPNVTVSSNASICSGSNTILTASGATSYSWSPSTALNSTTGSSVVASPSSSITYTVTGSSGSCAKSQTVSVSVTALPNILVSSNASICSGGSAALSASGGTTYSWSPSTALDVSTGPSVTATPANSITYTVTGISSGCSASKTVSVTVSAVPNVTVSPNTSVCSGSATALTASGATTFSWSPSTGLSSITGSSINASPTSTITYTVAGTIAGCSNTQTVSVSVIALPNLTTSSATSVCIGSSTVLTASGATTYTWSPAISLSASTGTSVSASPTYSTIYSVTGTAGSCSVTKSIVVTVNQLPVISADMISSSCSGENNGSIDISVTGQSPFSYYWSSGNTTEDISNLSGGNYSVTVTSSASCQEETAFTISPQSCLPVKVLGLSEIQSSSATIQWVPNPCSFGYKIRQRQLGIKKWHYYSALPADSSRFVGSLIPGVTYEYQVMNYCNNSFSDSTDYSVADTFTTLMNCIAPTDMTADNIESNAATLNWTSPEANNFRIRIRQEGTAGWTPYATKQGTTSLTIKNLLPSTTYVWQIRANCKVGGDADHSNFVNGQKFTTLQQPPRMDGPDEAQHSSLTDVRLYPNPTTGLFMVQSAERKENNVQVTVTDIYGREVIRENYVAEGDFSKAINISALPAGTYFVHVKKGDEVINKKITKQ